MIIESVQIVLKIYFDKLFRDRYLFWNESFYKLGDQFLNILNHLKQLDSGLPNFFTLYKNNKELDYLSIQEYEEIFDYLAFEDSEKSYDVVVYEIKAFFHWLLCVSMRTETQRRNFVEMLMRDYLQEYELRIIGNEKSKFFIVLGNVNIVNIDDISNYISAIKKYSLTTNGDRLFYRGHSSLNYILSPSIARRAVWRDNEQELCQEILLRCPQDFYRCNTHLEKLVLMQHYGLPTRLLDITTNPLVALYFACENTNLLDGEVIVLVVRPTEVKYASSDTISILASLYKFKKWEQDNIFTEAREAILFHRNKKKFNETSDIIKRLLHEIKTEKPAFSDNIDPNDLFKNLVVVPVRTNARIIRQEGAFILCSLSDKYPNLSCMRLQDSIDELIVLHISDKKRILHDLDMLGFNKASLFPEIDDVSDYLKNRR